MIPAKTDAQNATVSAMNGTEVAVVVALAGFLSRIECPHICLLISVGSLVLWRQSLNGDIQAAWLLGHRPDRARYLSLAVWPSRQARNAAAACSRSSALLSLRRGCFGGWPTSGILPLISSTPCRRIRSRLLIRVQLTRPVTTHPFKCKYDPFDANKPALT
jgi:hypothetical protein